MKKLTICAACLLIAAAMLFALPACVEKKSGADAAYKASEGLLVYYIYLVSYNFSEQELQEHNFSMDKSLKEQKYDEERSWYDVIIERAADALTRVLVYANAADENGIALDEGERGEIENKLVNHRMQAAAEGYKLDDYLAYIYNNTYVTETVLKSQLELSYLADKYAAVLEERFSKAVTDKMINEKLEATAGERDTTATRNIGNIVFSYDSYDDAAEAESAATEVFEKIKAEKNLTADVFGGYAEDYSDSADIFFDNVSKGDMIAPMNSWLYGDTGRKAGDVGVVKTDYGIHIMYYVSEGAPVYIANAKIAVIDDMFLDWYQTNKAKYNIGLTDEMINGINLDV